MRVIKEGVMPEARLYRVTCGKCHAVFEFAAGEARRSFDQRDGNCLIIECPTCVRDVYVNEHSHTGPG